MDEGDDELEVTKEMGRDHGHCEAEERRVWRYQWRSWNLLRGMAQDRARHVPKSKGRVVTVGHKGVQAAISYPIV